MFRQVKKYQKGGAKKLTPGDIQPSAGDLPFVLNPSQKDEVIAAQQQAQQMAKRQYLQADRSPVNYERRNQRNKQTAEAQGLTTDSQGRVSTLFNANSKGYNLLHNAGDVVGNVAETAMAVDGVEELGNLAKGVAKRGSAEALPSVTKPKELLDWFLGRRTPPPSGQKWLDEWMNDPITLNKISDRAGTKPEMPNYIPGESSVAMNKRFEDYQIKKATARPTYVRTDVKDVPIRSYDDLKNHNPNIHAAYNTVSGGVSLGDGNIFIDDKMYRHIPREKEKAIVHELTHRAEFNDASFTNKERQELSVPFGKDGTQAWDGNMQKYNDTYFTNPTEIHARMNEARYDLGLKPSDEFTEAHYNKVMKDNKFSGMGPYIKDKQSFIKLMNNFWALPPAVGVGAALQKEQQGGFSTLGYKKNSRDKNNPYNLINSNRITMQDVPHPVLGISDTGDQRLMMPGEEHSFDGNQVMEIPIRQSGGFQPLQQSRKPQDLSYIPAFGNSILEAIATRVNNNRDNSYQQNNLTNPLNYIPQVNNTNPYENLGVQQFQEGGDTGEDNGDDRDFQDDNFLFSEDAQAPEAQEAPEEPQQEEILQDPQQQEETPAIQLDTEETDNATTPQAAYVGSPMQAETGLDEDIIAQESGGNYKAENPNSSAVGKYQFLYNSWGPAIKAITGIGSKEEFKNSPEAQEKFYAWYKQSHMAPAVERLHSFNTKGLTDNQLGKLFHFKGEQGAREYLTEGIDKTKNHNTSIEHYIGKS